MQHEITFTKGMKEEKHTATDAQFLKEIFSYYKEHGRHELVWRKSITPYRILVSEIMLQQTQVVRVIPKFKLWMKVYPTLSVLRSASLKDVLILWQGLGYQRRAKALHTIAKTTSTLPRTFDELLALPGIGTYTASALCSFAYNTFSNPVLETNIRTALIHTYHSEKDDIDDVILYMDLKRLEGIKKVSNIGARAFYYALMDYGAHLKERKISHNQKSKGYSKQKPYKGSRRELRSKVLFAIAHGAPFPNDVRVRDIVEELSREGFITQKKQKRETVYAIP
jgi:A/G-specific adenine glycosylase